ncbi:hypothetical protein GCM10010329_23610 [Streptomyces spiroverticillatus]|uniref:Uncharacterized protein n=1 Tax=Streptomyces finlayi TaxID=67296 RepID=A0A918WUM9_9ACTN|nr:hypothetical protein GCM10010329_23610 [Streptomyces spiroverticillatus]GHC85661.1 hypothetical protein GCM10010334_16030 [Streptomyces finlayi]
MRWSLRRQRYVRANQPMAALRPAAITPRTMLRRSSLMGGHGSGTAVRVGRVVSAEMRVGRVVSAAVPGGLVAYV